MVTVSMKKIEGHLIQYREQGGEDFYCLADILDALDMKTHLIGGDIESPFIDEESAKNMFKTAESQKN